MAATIKEIRRLLEESLSETREDRERLGKLARAATNSIEAAFELLELAELDVGVRVDAADGAASRGVFSRVNVDRGAGTVEIVATVPPPEGPGGV